jgi:hypothetical protein
MEEVGIIIIMEHCHFDEGGVQYMRERAGRSKKPSCLLAFLAKVSTKLDLILTMPLKTMCFDCDLWAKVCLFDRRKKSKGAP